MIRNVDEIIESVSIERVIMKYIDLKRQGANYTACCPFHEEKTASFMVSPTKGIYKCFGCGEGGNAVKFVMEFEKCSFPEALEIVANMGNMTVKYDGKRDHYVHEYKEQKKEKTQLYAATKRAFELMQKNFGYKKLDESKTLELYPGTEFSVKTIKEFGVTYADKPKFGDDKKLLESIGWLKGDYYKYSKRVQFPIKNSRGNIIGLTARNLTGEKPKYINTPASKIFNKSETLFGIDIAWKHINKRGFAYIVEGPTDVMRMHEFGFKNTVGTNGTALNNEQIRLLQLYTNVVIQALDGDSAGVEAMERNVELFTDSNMTTKVLLLPTEQDPNNYLVDNGAKEFKKLSDSAEDGLIWIIDKRTSENEHDEVANINLAAELISKVDGDVKRAYYINRVYKLLKTTKAAFEKAVKEKRTEYITNQKRLSTQQQQMALEYGVYIDKNRYFVGDNAQAIEVSNFIFQPLFLVRANSYSLRLVQIINVKGELLTLDIDAGDFVELSSVKKVVEGKGNYVFSGNAQDYIRVKKLVYADTPTCFPITTLGYHRAGFWSWGNGISLINGEFKKVDRYGIVRHDDIAYYLPTFSEIKIDIHSDDDEIEDDAGEYIVYKKGNHWENWSKLFHDTYGNNGKVAMAHYFLTVFRDIIYKKYRLFPHLNLFGPQGSGKSTIGWSLVAMFGKKRDPLTINQTTDVAMYRRMAQVRNSYTWFEEFSLEVDKKRIDALKGFYDGNGRQKGKKSNTNATETTPVNSACIISGQVLPSQDPALLERCITLFFRPKEVSKLEEARLEELRELEYTGELSSITAALFQHREYIDKYFAEKLNIVKSAVKNMINFKIKTRILTNYCMLIAIADLINDKIRLPFLIDDLIFFCIERMKMQSDAVKGSDELQGFWVMFKYLIESGQLDEEDFMVQEVENVRIVDKNGDTQLIEYSSPKMLMFMRFDKAYPLYRENARKQGIERVLQLESLKYYISVNDAFVGKIKAKKLGTKAKRCWCLDANLLPVEFDQTKFNTEDSPSWPIPDNAIEDMKQKDPFSQKNIFGDEKK